MRLLRLTRALSLVSILSFLMAFTLLRYASYRPKAPRTPAQVVLGGIPSEARPGGSARIHVLTLRYMGQQGVGMMSLASLQCWLGSTGLPVAIVEPAISSSVLTGNILKEGVTLSDLFDLDAFNAFSRSVGYPQVVKREAFFEQASKNIVFARIGKKSELDLEEEDPTKVCQNMSSNRILRLFPSKGYCVVKVVSISNEHLTAKSFHDILGKWVNTNVTLIISRFGPWVLNQQDAKCKGVNDDSAGAQYQPSFRISSDVDKYKQLYLDASNPVAVMLRIEHVLHSNMNIRKCLDDVVDVTRRVEGKQTNGIPMVAVDFGKYGSNTWEWAITDDKYRVLGIKLAKQTVEQLLKNKMSFDEWEKTFSHATGNTVNEGYMAAVQKTIASRAKCLILVGGGHFHEAVLRDYLKFHSQERTWCVHLICTHNEKTLKGVIRSAKRASGG